MVLVSIDQDAGKHEALTNGWLAVRWPTEPVWKRVKRG